MMGARILPTILFSVMAMMGARKHPFWQEEWGIVILLVLQLVGVILVTHPVVRGGALSGISGNWGT